MTAKKILYASPTFLFRERCPSELGQIMKRLAEIGFDGLELYGMFGFSSDEILSFCEEHNLGIVSDHVHFDEFSKDTEGVISRRTSMGAKFLTIDNIPPAMMPGTKAFPEAVREIERISLLCKRHGVQLLYHNHGYDLMNKVDGIPMLDIILESTDPDLLKFQPDLGWISLGGGDPVRYLEKYKDRCPIIHIKDYFSTAPLLLESAFPLGKNRGGADYSFFEFRPSGYGIMNYPDLMPRILACDPVWITTDHDLSYERDTFIDMKMGLDYTKYLVSLNAGREASQEVLP
ncbi:MAG: sugar phosphate isomerase/epimerase [Spirochaetota bacterium]